MKRRGWKIHLINVDSYKLLMLFTDRHLNKEPGNGEPPPIDNCTQDVGYQQSQAQLIGKARFKKANVNII